MPSLHPVQTRSTHFKTAKKLTLSLAVFAAFCGAAYAQQTVGNLLVTPTQLDFGNVGLGQTSPGLTVTVTNNDPAAPVKDFITGISVGGPWSVTSNCIYITMASGASCFVTYQFVPAALGRKTATASIVVSGIPVSIRLDGTGVAASTPLASIPTMLVAPTCGFGVWSTVVNLNEGDGPAFVADMLPLLSAAVGQPLAFLEQNPCGTATLSGYKGGKLAFIPLFIQNDDKHPNGVYAVGNGQYLAVRAGQALVMVPALVHTEQALALLPGASARQADNGVMSIIIDGVTYVVQAGEAVKADHPSAGGQLALDKDGYLHFVDFAGNNQPIYPAFADSTALRNHLLGMDPAATLAIQLNGTAAGVLNGKPYTLVPDTTLTKTPADRAGQFWWQESATRYWMAIAQTSGAAVQGFTFKQN